MHSDSKAKLKDAVQRRDFCEITKLRKEIPWWAFIINIHVDGKRERAAGPAAQSCLNALKCLYKTQKTLAAARRDFQWRSNWSLITNPNALNTIAHTLCNSYQILCLLITCFLANTNLYLMHVYFCHYNLPRGSCKSHLPCVYASFSKVENFPQKNSKCSGINI